MDGYRFLEGLLLAIISGIVISIVMLAVTIMMWGTWVNIASIVHLPAVSPRVWGGVCIAALFLYASVTFIEGVRCKIWDDTDDSDNHPMVYDGKNWKRIDKPDCTDERGYIAGELSVAVVIFLFVLLPLLDLAF